jgi:hypothetical protein
MSLLYIKIHELLCKIPTEIIKRIIYEYVIEYQYMFSIDTEHMFTSVHFNKQLGIIYCDSKNHYKLINCNHNNDDAMKNIQTLCIYFDHNIFDNMIYFDQNSVIVRGNDGKNDILYMYYIGNKGICFDKYPVQHHNIQSLCTNNKHIYICEKPASDHYTLSDSIITHCRLTYNFNITASSDLYISVYDKHIYIVEIKARQTIKIHIHDFDTFKLIETKNTIIQGLRIRPYKDKLYHYHHHSIYIYDIQTLFLIDVINVKPFRKKQDMYNVNMIVADDIIMISGCNEAFFYEIN